MYQTLLVIHSQLKIICLHFFHIDAINEDILKNSQIG